MDHKKKIKKKTDRWPESSEGADGGPISKTSVGRDECREREEGKEELCVF